MSEVIEKKPISIVTPEACLNDAKRMALLKKIKETSGFSEMRFEALCQKLAYELVNYAQALPESHHSYYSEAYGIVDFALNRTEAALTLFCEFTLPEGSDVLTDEQSLWLYALLSASLLKSIGKLYTEYDVHLLNYAGGAKRRWNPLLEAMASKSASYQYEFLDGKKDEALRKRLNLLLAQKMMPESGYKWIVSNKAVLKVWLALLNEEDDDANILNDILERADAIAIQRDFGGLLGSYSHHRRYGVRSFANKSPISVEDMEHTIGHEFIDWLQKSLSTGHLMINKSPLFMVPGGLLMSADVFKYFVREHPEFKNWQAVKQGFLSLGLHEGDESVTEVVMNKLGVALPESFKIHNPKSGKTGDISAIELLHMSRSNPGYIKQYNPESPSALGRLSPLGEWEIEQEHAAKRSLTGLFSG